MHEIQNPTASPERVPWNRGKLIGPRPSLRQKDVWAIRTTLQIEQQVRDLALFNLAIDSKLRGCDVVAIRVDDVAPIGHAIARACVRQGKTGRPVRFELTEQTRQAINDYLGASGRKVGDYLFDGRRPGQSMTTRQYARLLSEWLILQLASIESTVRYLGIMMMLWPYLSRWTSEHADVRAERGGSARRFCRVCFFGRSRRINRPLPVKAKPTLLIQSGHCILGCYRGAPPGIQQSAWHAAIFARLTMTLQRLFIPSP